MSIGLAWKTCASTPGLVLEVGESRHCDDHGQGRASSLRMRVISSSPSMSGMLMSATTMSGRQVPKDLERGGGGGSGADIVGRGALQERDVRVQQLPSVIHQQDLGVHGSMY